MDLKFAEGGKAKHNAQFLIWISGWIIVLFTEREDTWEEYIWNEVKFSWANEFVVALRHPHRMSNSQPRWVNWWEKVHSFKLMYNNLFMLHIILIHPMSILLQQTPWG